MTSAELKHRVKLQEWAARIQDCRSSGLSVRAWCRQEEINAATYYRWERELLALAETEPCSSVSAVRFAELPAPKQVSRNAAERSATLRDTWPALTGRCCGSPVFVPTTPAASHGVSTLRLSSPYLQYDSNGTFRNVPLLLSHACPCAVRFDAYAFSFWF